MVQGHCLCGDISWELDGPLSMLVNCHCTMCRKAHGASFATFAAGPAAAFRWLGGEEKIVRYQSSAHGNRGFCGRCGSVVASVAGDLVFMPAGNLDGDLDRPLDSHIFVANKAVWHDISDDAPQFDGYPPGYDVPGIELEARTAATEGAVGGSCLCGAVRYEYDPPADRMVHCHCSRCRKSRSAAHSVQVFVPSERFRWLQGENNRTAYKVPGARYFAPSFCNDCGSVTPRVVAGGPAIIPAGLLDDDPAIRPQLHIFVGSKAPWFSITDSLPRYDEMPPAPGD
jgi:hypothetical protein